MFIDGETKKKMRLSVLFAVFLLVVVLVPSEALESDGVFLLSFKYSILSDPLSVLQSWNYDDKTPCSWKGVTCTQIGKPGTPEMFRVTALVLPNSQLLGSIPTELGSLPYLRHLDLSNNLLNGSLPESFFNSTELQVLSLSGNKITGGLPESVGGMVNLQLLNLADNAMTGKVPENITSLKNLTVVSLERNYFFGGIPTGFGSVQVLDLSSNLLNSSLPLDFGGDNLQHLNVSYNKIFGSISPEFSKRIPQNATIDLSFNNLTGAIPESLVLINQKTESFSGNSGLCGKPLKNLCSIPSTLSNPPNEIPPAIAVMPKPTDSSPEGPNNTPKGNLKPGTIAAIAVADLAGIAVLGMIILYVYQIRTRKSPEPDQLTTTAAKLERKPAVFNVVVLKSQPESSSSACSCLKLKLEESSEETSTSDSDLEDPRNPGETYQRGSKLVMIDGETDLEMETLLKASAYILGSSGSSIMYKAVLADGTAFAVRRIGECGISSLRDFENQVKIIAKLKHPNLVRVRGFYWGDDEKLVIYDYLPNGNLAAVCYRRGSASPSRLSLALRLRIAKGMARGLAYIHEKKQVHGDIKPSRILFNSQMEPIITGFGLDHLIVCNPNQKPTGSGRFLGKQRSDSSEGLSGYPIVSSSYAVSESSSVSATPYQAPEMAKSLKPNPKWDVYSFGMVLLELLAGRVLAEREVSQWVMTTGSVEEERHRVLRLADVAIRGEVEAKEEAVLALFRLGFRCASFLPQKRPSMKEAVQVLEKIPTLALC